ncbi:MAG: PhzF family phenazine biosynthesis protein [Holosporales bacterium]|nr:PhzF family phenazine biosynthesis protein [Holosporales bacterium]
MKWKEWGMQFWIVDTFSSTLFEGNPATVCLLEKKLTQPVLQKIAQEFNTHETVFVSPLQHQHFQIQWFTPTANESICGHGLLAAAHVLWNELAIEGIDQNMIYFDAPNGIFAISKDSDRISIRVTRRSNEPAAAPDRLINALGIPPIAVSKCGQIYIVELFSVKQVMKIEPDIAKLEKVACSGVVVTAEYGSDIQYDFASRFFAPSVGIKEDYATMWSHCFLGPYWEQRLSRNTFMAVQAAQRESVIFVKCEGDYVDVAGNCLVSASGFLHSVRDWRFDGDLFSNSL